MSSRAISRRAVVRLDVDRALEEDLDTGDTDLPVAFGGPLRLRVPRQLGYKSVKYINRLVVTDNLTRFNNGLGRP